ncbi:DUF1804 family protein, partial [Pseudomonas aeruginosa]
MAHPKETRDALRRAYVLDRQSLEVAAAMFGVSYGTASPLETAGGSRGGRLRDYKAQLGAAASRWRTGRRGAPGAGRPGDLQFQATMEAIQADATSSPPKVQLLASLA